MQSTNTISVNLPVADSLQQRRLPLLFVMHWILFCCICLGYPSHVLGQGLDSPVPVGPFLNGVFPTTAPNSPEDSTWAVGPAFPERTFGTITVVVPSPGDSKLYVGSRDGVIESFDTLQPSVPETLFLDLSDRVAVVEDGGFLGMAFHPEFGNPTSPFRNYFYVYYASNCPIDAGRTGVDLGSCVGYPTGPTDGFFGVYLRLSRFEVPDGSSVADPASETVLMNIELWNESHRGGGMLFGNDGYLYVTIGDQFRFETAQGIVDDLDGGVHRIAVDVSEIGGGNWTCPAGSHLPRRRFDTPTQITGQLYCIPDDNPWLDVAGGVFEEYYSLGLRNPHRLSKDTTTGRLWAGEVGHSTREEINVIEKGRNYGWPFREGKIAGPVSPPASYIGVLTDPVIDFPRSEAQVIIGGYVYRGTEFPELVGKYLAGDFATSRIWAVTLDESNMTATAEFLTFFDPGFLATWGQDNDGNVYLGSVAGVNPLYRLNRVVDPVPDPPALLSAIGAFDDLLTLDPVDAAIPYELNQPFWSDGAVKSRWVLIPNDGTHDTPEEQVVFSENSDWIYPAGTVFIKHFELGLDESDPDVRTRLETRFEVLGVDGDWYGLTYRWLPDQTDAVLLTQHEFATYQIATSDGGTRDQVWDFPGRDQCRSCHNPASGGALGPRTHQLNRDFTYAATGETNNQLLAWNQIGIFSPSLDPSAIPDFPKSSALEDTGASLEDRARSYLDANCSYCHRPETLNRAVFDARFTTPLPQQLLIGGSVINDLGIENARIVAAGDPARSILLHRMAAIDTIAMPPLAKSLVDEPAVELITAWIEEAVQPVDMSLLVHYPFAADGGGVIEDSSANGFDAACTVGGTCPVFVAGDGQPAGAYDFTGSGNYIELPNESAFDFTTTFTAALWIKTSDFGNTWAQLIGKGDSAWSLDRNGSTNLLSFTTFSPNPNGLVGSTDVADGQWHHVAIVYDGQQKTLYVDGQVDAQAPFTAAISTNNVNVRLGYNTEYPAGQYDGLLDEVRIYSRALSQSEVRNLMVQGTP